MVEVMSEGSNPTSCNMFAVAVMCGSVSLITTLTAAYLSPEEGIIDGEALQPIKYSITLATSKDFPDPVSPVTATRFGSVATFIIKSSFPFFSRSPLMTDPKFFTLIFSMYDFNFVSSRTLKTVGLG